MTPMPRRHFLSLSAGAALLPRSLLADVTGGAGQRTQWRARPFELSAVRLLPGPALDALEVNRGYLMSLDSDRLLHMFRLTAGLATSAQPLGGWEAPDNELRGHFTGHYLSACALLAAHAGDAAVRERGIQLARELAACQKAHGDGYLSAFPRELFVRLREGKPAWAPFYTLHKIMAGLLDTYRLSGDRQALATLSGMAGWTERWVQPLDEVQMARVLEREYGGMNEVLYNLADVTAQSRWRRLAQRFDRHSLYAPLAAGEDQLQGLHANTTIPQIVGAARGFEVTGAPQLRSAASYFWQAVAWQRCYCTGGTSDGEHWNGAPGELAQELSGYTEESCCTYNMHKLTRLLFGWTADPALADYYERAWYNGILGVQHPSDGAKLYYLPLQSGYWKLFGTPLEDFWCCSGSMAEAFAKLGDSIYFHDDTGLYVNLFVPSELNWRERALRVVLDTRLPLEDTVRLTLHTQRPQHLALRMRVPGWTTGGAAWLNGAALEHFSPPGSYLTLERTWRDGDEVKVQLPMRLQLEPLARDPTLQAVRYGPLVLAGRLGNAGLNAQNLRAPPTRPRTVPEYPAGPVEAPLIVARGMDAGSWLESVPGRPLEFRTIGQPRSLTLVPLNSLFDERYAVYWKVQVGAVPA
jgi:uncharacterized protein